MKVTVELEPKDWWMLAGRAEASGQRVPDYIRTLLTDPPDVMEGRVTALWTQGLCDADIATALGVTVLAASQIRRGLKLPANRRYPRRNSA